jgi:hypothetical protein
MGLQRGSLKADLKASNIFRRNPFATPYFVLSSSCSIFASRDIKLSYNRIFGGVIPHTSPVRWSSRRSSEVLA